MMSLLLLVFFVAAVLFLIGGLGSFYRYITRSRLFPQLPRLWKPDLNRTIIFGVLLAISLAGLFGLGMATGSDQSAQMEERDPSLYPTAPAKRPASPVRVIRGEERVLPPATVTTTTMAAPTTTLAPTTTTTAPTTTTTLAPTTTTTTIAPTTTTTTTTTTKPPAPPTTRPAAKPTKPPTAQKGPHWTVCFSSYRTLKSARVDAKRLRDFKMPSQIHRVQVKGKGWWYRVCVGIFDNRAQAEAQAARWKKAGLVKSPFPYLAP